jgi:hypothetical protein
MQPVVVLLVSLVCVSITHSACGQYLPSDLTSHACITLFVAEAN